MLALVSISVCVFSVCVVPFIISSFLAVRDVKRTQYRLTNRVSVVAATLTILYSLGVCVFQSSISAPTADDLIHWIAVIGMWDLVLMFCSSIFALLGYLTGASWGTARLSRLVGRNLPVSSDTNLAKQEESGNPYQVPRVDC